MCDVHVNGDWENDNRTAEKNSNQKNCVNNLNSITSNKFNSRNDKSKKSNSIDNYNVADSMLDEEETNNSANVNIYR